MDSEDLARYYIPQFMEYEAAYYLDSNFDKFALALTHELPLIIKCVAFCMFHRIGCVDGARLCSVSAPTFRKRVKQFNRYTKYTKFWYENRDIVDIVIKATLVQRSSVDQKKFNIFTDLLRNPFQKPGMLAERYGLKGKDYVIRGHVRDCAKAMIEVTTIDEDFNQYADIIVYQLLKPFLEIVFDQLKKVKKIKKYPRKEPRRK